jgi:outer membrane murein-binding lipoprotein Lpp
MVLPDAVIFSTLYVVGAVILLGIATKAYLALRDRLDAVHLVMNSRFDEVKSEVTDLRAVNTALREQLAAMGQQLHTAEAAVAEAAVPEAAVPEAAVPEAAVPRSRRRR